MFMHSCSTFSVSFIDVAFFAVQTFNLLDKISSVVLSRGSERTYIQYEHG